MSREMVLDFCIFLINYYTIIYDIHIRHGGIYVRTFQMEQYQKEKGSF